MQKLSPSVILSPPYDMLTSSPSAGTGLRIDGTMAMGTPLVGYASFETDGENISGLAVQLVNDNASVVWPSKRGGVYAA